MDFTDLLRRRRMVRHYRPDPVPDEVITRVVSVVRRAPSAGFSQGHHLAVVTNPEIRAGFAEVAEGWYVERGHQPWISQAPVHVVLGIRENAYHERYREPDKTEEDGSEIPWPVPFWWFDCGALLVLLQLAASNEGLATGFYSPAAPDDLAALARLAGLPDDVALAGILTLGHAAAEPDSNRQRIAARRKPLDQLVHWRR